MPSAESGIDGRMRLGHALSEMNWTLSDYYDPGEKTEGADDPKQREQYVWGPLEWWDENTFERLRRAALESLKAARAGLRGLRESYNPESFSTVKSWYWKAISSFCQAITRYHAHERWFDTAHKRYLEDPSYNPPEEPGVDLDVVTDSFAAIIVYLKWVNERV